MRPSSTRVGDAADAGADDGNARHERLVNHERRVLEPEGRDDQDVDLRIDLGGPLAIERAHEPDRQAGRLRAEPGGVVGKDVRVAEDLQLVGAGIERADSVEQHVHAFVPDERAHVADSERSPLSVTFRRGRS